MPVLSMHIIFLFVVLQGVGAVREEMGDIGESLIEMTQGHGGQGLINLLITGRASPYVWDGAKDVGGLSK